MFNKIAKRLNKIDKQKESNIRKDLFESGAISMRKAQEIRQPK